MHYYVYKITNLINNKIYIGVHKTDNLNDGYMGSGKLIQRAIKKYGVDNSTKDILFFGKSYEEVLEKEKELVSKKFVDEENNYNLKIGGYGGFDYINSNEKILKQKSEKYKGEGNPFYNKTHDQEVKQYLSKLAKQQWSGIPKSEKHKEKIRLANTGKTFSEERIKNISLAKKGKPAWNKGIAAEKWTCPNCGKVGGGASNKSKHFIRCGV